MSSFINIVISLLMSKGDNKKIHKRVKTKTFYKHKMK